MTVQPHSCPKCGAQFPYDASLIGKRVRCPVCQHVFVVSAPAQRSAATPPSNVPRVPIPTAAVDSETSNPTPDFTFISPERTETTRYQAERQTSIFQILWAFLDLRLDRYLTPYIIRFYWAVALLIILLYGIGITLEFVLESPSSAGAAVDSPEAAMREFFQQPELRSSSQSDVVKTYDRIKTQIVKYLAITCMVLAVRVWCEVLIVAFNIANFVKSINAGVKCLAERRASPEP